MAEKENSPSSYHHIYKKNKIKNKKVMGEFFNGISLVVIHSSVGKVNDFYPDRFENV